MNLEHEFTVPMPVDEAWKVLLDVERVAPCMPGATLLTVDGDEFTGSVKVKVGPIQVTYKGNARFASKDDTAHRAVIQASGKEARGSGTAAATVTTSLVADGDRTKVNVTTDLNVTGRPAQFGRGVMSEVAAKLIDQFSSCIADEMGGPSSEGESSTGGAAVPPTAGGMTEPAPAPATPLPSGTTTSSAPSSSARTIPPSSTPRRTPEAINLLETAGLPVAKRLLPAVAALLVVLFIWRRRRR
jgi:uncharacterized protein